MLGRVWGTPGNSLATVLFFSKLVVDRPLWEASTTVYSIWSPAVK